MNLPKAAAAGLTTLAWYALPDVVHGRRLRGVLKTALLGAFAGAWSVVDRPAASTPGPDRVDTILATVRENPGRAAAVAGTVVAVGTALTVAGERAIFAFGERRRARGVRCAHTLPALALGALAAAGVLFESAADGR
ncbi:MAG: peptidase S9 [Nigerium sp.]|nr:peptidase S9 [Nigerium sp.]